MNCTHGISVWHYCHDCQAAVQLMQKYHQPENPSITEVPRTAENTDPNPEHLISKKLQFPRYLPLNHSKVKELGDFLRSLVADQNLSEHHEAMIFDAAIAELKLYLTKKKLKSLLLDRPPYVSPTGVHSVEYDQAREQFADWLNGKIWEILKEME